MKLFTITRSRLTAALAGFGLALLLALGAVLAAGETLSRGSFGSGGGTVSSADDTITLTSSLGQPFVSTGSSSSIELCSGPLCGPNDQPSATTPPVLTSTSPGDGSTDVSPDQPVVLSFSQPMDTTSVAYTIVPAVSGISERWSNGDTVLTLDHDPFAVSTTYTITVTAASDTEGQALTNAPFEWSFTSSVRVPDPSESLFLPLVNN